MMGCRSDALGHTTNIPAVMQLRCMAYQFLSSVQAVDGLKRPSLPARVLTLEEGEWPTVLLLLLFDWK